MRRCCRAIKSAQETWCCWLVRNKFKYYHNTKSVIINGFTWFMRCCCHIIKLSGNQLFCRKTEIGRQVVSVPIPVAMGNMGIYWPSAPKYKSFSRSAPPLKKIVKHCFSSQAQQLKLGQRLRLCAVNSNEVIGPTKGKVKVIRFIKNGNLHRT